MRSQFLFVAMALVLLPLLADSASDRVGGLPGGWFPVDNVNDPHLKEIAKFAIEEYNKKSNSGLKFVSLLKAERQVVSGTNYRLLLEVKKGSTIQRYEAVVYERLRQESKTLTSFKPVN